VCSSDLDIFHDEPVRLAAEIIKIENKNIKRLYKLQSKTMEIQKRIQSLEQRFESTVGPKQ
jgi:hypothetical protein